MTSVPHAALRRNALVGSPDLHQHPRAVTGLTAGGKLIWLRTRRPTSTCNLLAALAGIGAEAS